MNERILELKKKMEHLDELVDERDKAYQKYMLDVEKNKTQLMCETLNEIQEQISADRDIDTNELDDMISDLFECKCKKMPSYEKYIKLRSEIMIINKIREMRIAQE